MKRKKDALFDAPAKDRWTGSKELVRTEVGRCPRCGDAVQREVLEEPALVRHGGYGATRRSVREHCPCGFSLLVEESEVKPAGAPDSPSTNGGFE